MSPCASRVAAAILAGGKASRLHGIAKGLLPDDSGRSIVARLIAELAAAGIKDVVISANVPQPYANFGLPIVADVHEEIGPMGGIEAVLQYLEPDCDYVVLLPCDLPAITVQEILKLLRVQQTQPDRIVIAGTREADGNRSAQVDNTATMQADGTRSVPAGMCEHPLCGVVPVKVLPQVSAAIARGSYGVGRLWRSLGALIVEIDDAARLLNINTPDDLRQWRSSVPEQRNI